MTVQPDTCSRFVISPRFVSEAMHQMRSELVCQAGGWYINFSHAMSKSKQRGRKDHYVPRGYLRGFIDPARESMAKPFWKYDLEIKIWSMESPGSVGWERGFYDYAEAHPDLVHPDETFDKFEREFSSVREHMLRRNFKAWVRQDRAFLLGYIQMMCARSPMFIEHQTEQNRKARGVTVTSVGPGNVIGVDSLELRPPPETFVRNRTITQMREEVERGTDWLGEFNWCLRYTRSIDDPFVTADQPVIANGVEPDRERAFQSRETLIYFPICWQACLVGSRLRFNEGTDEATRDFMRHVRGFYVRSTKGYVISPRQLADDMFERSV